MKEVISFVIVLLVIVEQDVKIGIIANRTHAIWENVSVKLIGIFANVLQGTAVKGVKIRIFVSQTHAKMEYAFKQIIKVFNILNDLIISIKI